MKKIVLSLLALSALIFSCSKDDDDKTSANELIIGKWGMESQYRNVVTNNVGKRDTTVIPAGLQTWEFTNKGKVYMFVQTVGGPSRDTGDYTISGSNVILKQKTLSDTFKLVSISGSALQAYKKLINSSTKYTEYWFNYKKQ